MQRLTTVNSATSDGYLLNKANGGAINVANLVLKLLPSKEGVVLRRLLMTAVSAFLCAVLCFEVNDYAMVSFLIFHV